MSNSEMGRDTEEPLWRVADVMTYLNVSKSWAYERAAAGILPSVTIGGLRRFIPAEIRAWAAGEPLPPRKVVALSGRR